MPAGLVRLIVFCGALAASFYADACEVPDGPPDSLPVTAAGAGLVRAELTHATTRYDHGVLGDAIEAGGLRAWTSDGPECGYQVVLPQTRVFEDTAPRLADVTGDGRNDIIVVETDIARGAQLAVYALRAGVLTRIAATDPIGRTHRWLAPAGIADFDGDGQRDIAYVDRPHLARILRFVTLDGDALVEIGAVKGLTNHRIGDRKISGGVRHCPGHRPEIVAANGDWSALFAAGWRNGDLNVSNIAHHPGSAIFASAFACK